MRSLARTLWEAIIGVLLMRSRWLRRRQQAAGQAAAAGESAHPVAAQPQPATAAGGPPEEPRADGEGKEQPPLQTLGHGAPGDVDDGYDPSKREIVATPWSERSLAVLLVLTMLAGGCFAGLYVYDPNTQLLGLSIGLMFAFLAAAFILAGKRVVPQETKVEERPELLHPEELAQVADRLHSGAEGITRRKLLVGAAGAAGTGLAAAAVFPIVGLGPGAASQFEHYPWQDGTLLVDEENQPISAEGIREGSMYAAFPQGANKEDLRSPVVLVRVPPSQLRLPAARSDWAPLGILAYSKICTHAGCAISLYRSPLHPSTESRPPALVCPCHYSTFNVEHACHVEFGPAGRPLPQLPLKIDAAGYLRAGGGFSGPVGPSWWGDSH